MGADLENQDLIWTDSDPAGLDPASWEARFTRQAGWTAGLRQYLYERLDLPEGGRVLDVGCGTGALLGELLRRGSLQVCGIDLNHDFLRRARQAGAGRPAGRLSLAQADAHTLPFSASTFDLALCHFLLLWVADPARVLAAMRRAVRPGGAVLALAEPDYGGRLDYPPELAILGAGQRAALRRQGAQPELGRRLKALFLEAGLELVEAGILGAQWQFQPEPEEFASEWAVLRADLQRTLPEAELEWLQELDAAAWGRGERVLFVPTFYAWGRVPA